MTAPSGYLRKLREEQALRRLGVANALRETPDATNIELARIFGVTRDTIAQDRRMLVDTLNRESLTETGKLRDELCQELIAMKAEVEKHRKQGKL